MLLSIKFKIRGSLRFLSHAEMLRVFQRAIIRCDVDIEYSHGFNPRPRISLPLPKPVGTEADEELFCARLHTHPDTDALKDELIQQLPVGCEVLSLTLQQENNLPQPCSASYLFRIGSGCDNDKLKNAVDNILNSQTLVISRHTGKSGSNPKNVDVRGFVKSIKFDDNVVTVRCNIDNTGSIRAGEIMDLLGLDEHKLSNAVKRINVEFRNN